MLEAKNIKVEIVGKFLRVGINTLFNPEHIISVKVYERNSGYARLTIYSVGGKYVQETSWDFGSKTDDKVLADRFRAEAGELLNKICSALEMLSIAAEPPRG